MKLKSYVPIKMDETEAPLLGKELDEIYENKLECSKFTVDTSGVLDIKTIRSQEMESGYIVKSAPNGVNAFAYVTQLQQSYSTIVSVNVHCLDNDITVTVSDITGTVLTLEFSSNVAFVTTTICRCYWSVRGTLK